MQTDDYTEVAPDFMGRILNSTITKGFATAKRMLRDGEALFFLHDRRIEKVVVPADDQASFDRAAAQHHAGHSISYRLVASAKPVLITVLVQAEDGGPVEIQQAWVKQ